ncbi:hypothetical protein [Clostridium sp. OS1-26]|uniref:hypothetical protein n=1 Tax=Clostridium sp. OS1-26 TaxID=3070681 RepID=UPI0027E127D2|nr:hypothetical protein [Clostridium sp. OS1-26]WML35651.1 hypothetical protein RCG18_02545 [Clostridium sp. OS1-26]
MSCITISLTPGRYFVNLNKSKIEKILNELNFKSTSYVGRLSIYKNNKNEIIKLREDGSLYYKVNVDTINNNVVSNILLSVEEIINKLNLAYDDLLNTNKLFIYWPDNFDGNNLNLINYFITTDKILSNKYTSILRKKICYCA